MSRSFRSMMFAGMMVGLAACGTQTPTGTSNTPAPTTPAAPTAGWLTLQLVTPRGDDGAVQFLVTGPGFDSVRVISYNGSTLISGDNANIIVTGAVSGGTVAQVHVADLSLAGDYQAQVVAAAARSSYALQDLTGYRALLIH